MPESRDASPPSQKTPPAKAGSDGITSAVIFAILGGCCALWMADLSLVVGTVTAMISGVLGVLFAET